MCSEASQCKMHCTIIQRCSKVYSAYAHGTLQDGAPLMDGLAALLDSSSSPLRAKAILALALLTQLSPTWLLAAFRKGILIQV